MSFGGQGQEWLLAKYGMTELRQRYEGDSFVSHFGTSTDTVEMVRDAVDHMLFPGAFDRIHDAQTMVAGDVKKIWSLYFPTPLYKQLLAEYTEAKFGPGDSQAG